MQASLTLRHRVWLVVGARAPAIWLSRARRAGVQRSGRPSVKRSLVSTPKTTTTAGLVSGNARDATPRHTPWRVARASALLVLRVASRASSRSSSRRASRRRPPRSISSSPRRRLRRRAFRLARRRDPLLGRGDDVRRELRRHRAPRGVAMRQNHRLTRGHRRPPRGVHRRLPDGSNPHPR